MMLSLDDLNVEQGNAVEDLRIRVKDILNQDMYQDMNEDILLFYRFLEAREFRVNDAENMFRKHIIWRKANQVETIQKDFKPKEFYTKYVEPTPIGFDKDGSLVLYTASGKKNPKDFYKCEKKHNFTRHLIWFLEKAKNLQMEQYRKYGRKATQISFILDADQLTFGNATCKETIDFFFTLTGIAQDNYPELLKKAYLINAPSYYTILLTILKTVMSNKMINKLHHFGTSGWKEKLLEDIDADTLPAFLGGNRTDPDGDPLCKTFVNHGGKIPATYYLSDEDRYFKKGSKINKVIVPPSGRKNITVEVKAERTLIQWEFYCRSDIDFGLFHEQLDKKLEEVIPIVKYDTSTGTEKNFYRTHSSGKYIIIFENTSSWLSKKEVEYCIDIINPEL